MAYEFRLKVRLMQSNQIEKSKKNQGVESLFSKSNYEY